MAMTRKDKRNRIEVALEREGLRHACQAIDRGHDGEVILWHGVGHVVHTVAQALRWTREQQGSSPYIYTDEAGR